MYVWVSFYIVSGRYSWWWEILMGLNKKKNFINNIIYIVV